jgi:hypothetical protein
MSLKKRQAAFYPKTKRPLSKRAFCFDPILPAEVHGYRTHPGEIIKKLGKMLPEKSILFLFLVLISSDQVSAWPR